MNKHLQSMGIMAGSIVLGIVLAVLVSWKLGLVVGAIGAFGGFVRALANMASMMKNPNKMFDNF